MKKLKWTDTFKKSLSVTVTEALLTQTASGVKLESSKVDVFNGLQCLIEWYPNGRSEEEAGRVSVYLWVSSPVKAKYKFIVELAKERVINYTFPKSEAFGWREFATHQEIRYGFENDTATIVCDAEFEVNLSRLTHNLFETSDDVPFDCEFVVGDERVEIHKNLLALVSPSLYANFTHDTVEAKTGKINILDFEYKIVKASVDFLYDHLSDDSTIETIIGMLRFFDKYNIQSSNLEYVPHINITNKSFSTIVHYAYDCYKDPLFKKCATFFSENIETVKTKKGFQQLPVKLIIQLLEAAFSLESVCDVLQKAHQNNILAVNDYLDPTLTISIDNFCETANYAFNCDRPGIQLKCAEFFSVEKHRSETLFTDKFLALSGDTVMRILHATKDSLDSNRSVDGASDVDEA